VDTLQVKEDGVYVDCTFGRGGHSREILRRLGGTGRLLALDRDPAAVAAAQDITDTRFTALSASFGQLRRTLAGLGIERVNGVLMDLGVSSPQLEDAGRGFSFKLDGPLDMRMDTSRGITAAQWLATASENQIGEVIKTYGEERFARQIARAVVAARSRALLLPQDNLPRSWRRPSVRASRGSTRRHARSRLYGFSSTASSRSFR
jgi:16S rRNA (cytosine1402-N4)-methyltransferase